MPDGINLSSKKTDSSRRSWPAAGVCAVAGWYLFQFFGNATLGYIRTHSLFRWWAYQWVNPESETQHGLVVLALSAWLLRRNLVRSGAGGSSWSGRALAAMVAGLALHGLGFVSEQARVSIGGLLLFAWGVAALGGGSRWGRASAFPLAFMAFAIPINALDSAGFWLRMWVVDFSAAAAHGFGVAVIKNGTQLLAPDGRYDYDVAAACSGVRSLTALAALSLLVGYLRFRPFLVRAGFLALSVPLVLAGNVIRVISIVVAAHLGGPAWGDRAHEVMGYGVFAIVLGGVLLAAELAARVRPAWVDPAPSPGGSGRPGAGAPSPAGEGGRPWAAAAGAILAAVCVGAVLNHVAHSPSRGQLGIALRADGLSPVELPTFLGSNWIGRDAEVTDVERRILPADTGYSRKTYVSLADPRNGVFLSIVLSGRDRTSIHRPELCLVGQGWTIRDSYVHRFGRGDGFPARVLRVEKAVAAPGGRVVVPQLVAYYFVGGDVVVADHWERIARDAWNRVIHGRADRWAYVLLQTGDSDGDAAALARIQEVLDATLPAFQRSN
jgi:exosortase